MAKAYGQIGGVAFREPQPLVEDDGERYLCPKCRRKKHRWNFGTNINGKRDVICKQCERDAKIRHHQHLDNLRGVYTLMK